MMVVGGHRCGTSATAHVLGLLGLELPPVEDLMPANSDNPDGFFESLTLTEFNDRLLARLGSAWDAPPAPGGDLAGLSDLTQLARTLVDRLFPRQPWVWKDPRTSLLLPFWRQVVPEAVYLLVHRPAVPAAMSLVRREHCSPVFALGLWQRYYTEAMAGLVGAPVVVLDWEELRNQPEPSIRRLSDELGSLGVATRIDPDAWASLRPATAVQAGDPPPAEAEKLREKLKELAGPHEAFPDTTGVSESPWVEPLLAAHRRARVLRLAS